MTRSTNLAFTWVDCCGPCSRDYFLNDVFGREVLRVLNRGEAVNALKRAIYIGRVAIHQAKQSREM